MYRLRRVVAIAFSSQRMERFKRGSNRSGVIKLPSARSSSSVMRLWPVVGYTVAAGRRLTSFGRQKVRAGCHFGDHTLLGGESAIQRVGKDDRENRGQKIGVHEQSAVRIKAGDFY